uniref:Uncharacterized protein n=1 Tax=Tetranychus urticae TaxID=32264 RepID=T1K292_TETUR
MTRRSVVITESIQNLSLPNVSQADGININLHDNIIQDNLSYSLFSTSIIIQIVRNQSSIEPAKHILNYFISS